MFQSRYQFLLDEISTLCDQPPPAFDGEFSLPSITLELEGTRFGLAYLCHGEEHLLQLTCQFGPLPVARREMALQRLMEANAVLPRDPFMRFCIDPVGSDVVLEYGVSLDQVDAQSVVAGMQEAARQARQWRQNHYLDDLAADNSTESIESFA